MGIKDILKQLDEGIAIFLESENDILARNLNEVNLSANLSNCLKYPFKDYDVDPEYNGDWDKLNDRKALDIAKNRIREIGKEINASNNYKVKPDIIIHKRKSNDANLVVIEVKKDVHPPREKHYDLIKLEHLTIDYAGNHYNYKLGVALVLGTGRNAGTYNIKYFQSGIELSRDKLT